MIRVNEKNTDFSEDAVVIGGSGENARRCISAASCNIKMEILPEVRELCDWLIKKDETVPETSPGQNTAAPSDGAASDQPSREDGGSSIRVYKSGDSRPRGESGGKTAADGSHQARRFKKAIAVAAAALLVLLIGFAVYEAYSMMHIMDSVNYSSGNLRFDKVDVLVSQSETELFVSHTDETKSILLCGCDIDKNGISRTDSMIILSIDHAHGKIKMTSLMRDMYLRIPGHGKNKLNASYTFGGGDLLLQTIYSNFGMKIDKYVCVDYAVFAAVVDDLGGVEVEIEEMELEQFNKYVRGGKKNRISQAGTYNFNGQQALSYCSIRKVGTDTARTARQRKVLREIIRKCRTLSPFEAKRILSVVAPCLTTNMTRDEMTSLMLEGLNSRHYDTMGLRIPMNGAWKDKKTDNAWFVEVDLNKNARFLNQFIYGDDETAQALVNSQQKSDDQSTEYNRWKFEKRKKRAENKQT